MIQHILRLQIAVHDANVMRGARRARAISAAIMTARVGSSGPRSISRAACAPFDVFRGDEQASVNLPSDAHRRCATAGCCRWSRPLPALRGAAARAAPRRHSCSGEQRLQRDAPSEASVARAIDDPHAAAADLEFDLVSDP